MSRQITALWGVVGLVWAASMGRAAVGESAPATIVVAQDGEGEFNGMDETPILAAVAKVRQAGGGTIEIRAGQYLIRRGIKLPSGIVIRGTAQTMLKLASPVLTTSLAKQGQDYLEVGDASELAAGACLEVFPPVGMKTFPEGGKGKYSVEIRHIERGRLVLSRQIPHPIPAKSRVGYASNLFFVGGSAKNIRLENLVLDGGRKTSIPMPGHCDRCALLAHGIWSYQDGPTAPPIENVEVLECHVRNCYGRAAAMYSVVRGKVKGCLIEDIDDEAIDLDHFCRHCEVSGNLVRRGQTGVTINDGSYCTIRGNRFEHCGVGVSMWWWYQCPQKDLNVENLIENNTIVAPQRIGISLGKKCLRNRVVGNTVEGGIQVAEPGNVVEKNTPKQGGS